MRASYPDWSPPAAAVVLSSHTRGWLCRARRERPLPCVTDAVPVGRKVRHSGRKGRFAQLNQVGPNWMHASMRRAGDRKEPRLSSIESDNAEISHARIPTEVRGLQHKRLN